MTPARLALALAAVCSTLAACGTETPVARAPMGGPTPSAKENGPAVVQAAPPPSHAPTTDAEDAHPLTRKLGHDCGPQQREEKRQMEPCGKSGRVSLAMMTRAERRMPCEPRDVAVQTSHTMRACVQGEQIWVTSECIVCRSMLSGWTLTAWAPDLTDEQRQALVKRLGLDADPGSLATAGAWANAFNSAAEEVARKRPSGIQGF